jgi:hypothetical protein
MKLVDPTESSPPFVPENPTACEVIRGMWNDVTSSNVMIEVGDGTFTLIDFSCKKVQPLWLDC